MLSPDYYLGYAFAVVDKEASTSFTCSTGNSNFRVRRKCKLKHMLLRSAFSVYMFHAFVNIILSCIYTEGLSVVLGITYCSA